MASTVLPKLSVGGKRPSPSCASPAGVSLLHNRMALHGYELFVLGVGEGEGEREEVVKLYDLRRSVKQAKGTFSTIRLPAVEAGVKATGLLLNASGTRMAVLLDDRKIAVAKVPGLVLSATRSGPIDCKWTMLAHVGSIVQAAWHPLSDTGSHLAVLTAKGLFVLYNVDAEKDAEQSFQLTGKAAAPQQQVLKERKQSSGRFAIDDDDDDEVEESFGSSEDTDTAVVSFAIGQGSLWQPFTVYFLQSDGAVTALCPVCPNGSTFALEQLQQCLQASKPNSPATQWLESLICCMSQVPGQICISQHGSNLPSWKAFLQPAFSLLPENPFKNVTASDVCFIPGQAVPVLVVTTTAGCVYSFAVLEPPKPLWKHEQLLRRTDTLLAFVDIVDCQLPSFHAKTIASVALHLDESFLQTELGLHPTVLVSHGCGVHVVSFPWFKELQSGQTNVAAWRSLFQAPICRLDGDTSLAHLRGVAVVNDVVLGHIILYLTPSAIVDSVPLQFIEENPAEVVDETVVKPKPAPKSNAVSEVESKAAHIMLPPHFVVPEGDKVSHEALLNDAAKALREKTIAPALALSTQLESKLNEIADHEKRQHDNLGKLEKEIQACDDESKRLQEHLDSTLANVLYTSRRSALLLNLVLDLSRRDLNDSEIEFGHELKKWMFEQKGLSDAVLALKEQVDQLDAKLKVPRAQQLPGDHQLEILEKAQRENDARLKLLVQRFKTVEKLFV